MRRLGADNVTARRGRGSEEFGPLDSMPQHQQGTDPPSSPRMPQPRHNANSRSNATCGGFVSEDCTFGLDVAASLDRRRTSIVNDGTARLNVVLDTAYGSANSFRPRRLCEAMRSKAIADYCGGEQRVVSAAPPILGMRHSRPSVAQCSSSQIDPMRSVVGNEGRRRSAPLKPNSTTPPQTKPRRCQSARIPCQFARFRFNCMADLVRAVKSS